MGLWEAEMTRRFRRHREQAFARLVVATKIEGVVIDEVSGARSSLVDVVMDVVMDASSNICHINLK
jgi:hypothetical protein